MKLERINGKLVLVSSARGTRMLGGAMALFGIYLFAAFMSLAGSTLWIKIFVIVWGLGFVGGSLLALFVPDITTEFDLAERNATIQRSRRLGTTTRATVIPFGEIASLTWKRHVGSEGPDTYGLELEHRDGEKFSLTASSTTSPDSNVIATILLATGIRRPIES